MEGVAKFEGMEFHPEVRKIARIWPFLNDTEAFTIFKIRKTQETLPASVRRGRTPQGRVLGREADRDLRRRLEEYFKPYGAGEFFRGARLFRSGDHIWIHTEDYFPLFERAVFNRVGVKAVRVYSNGQMRPTHAFLMAFPELFREAAWEVDEELARRFAYGENLPAPKGALEYVPIFFRGHPLGWGKRNEGFLLNKIPTPLVLR
jgi:NOL1/NOP2/fmu family ribosome biogenesis protein